MYVYFIYNPSTTHYKVGKTISLEQRIKQLQTGNEVRLVIKKFIDDQNPEIEKYLHEYFKDKKILNEWFDITSADVERVINLVEYANKLKKQNTNLVGDNITDPRDIRLITRILKWTPSKKDLIQKNDQYSSLKRFIIGMLLIWVIMILIFKV